MLFTTEILDLRDSLATLVYRINMKDEIDVQMGIFLENN